MFVALVAVAMVMPVMLPPVIATELAFWPAMVPSPETEVDAMEMATLEAAVNCPCALTVKVGTVVALP